MCPGETTRDCYTFEQSGCHAYGTGWGDGINDSIDGDDDGLSDPNIRYSVCCSYLTQSAACNTPGDTSDDDDSPYGYSRDSRCCPSTQCTRDISQYNGGSFSPTAPTAPPTDAPTAAPTLPAGWPDYYTWGTGEGCPCVNGTLHASGNPIDSGDGCHDILDYAECLNAYTEIYANSHGQAVLPGLSGYYSDLTRKRGCTYLPHTGAGGHDLLINYATDPTEDAYAHVALCKNHHLAVDAGLRELYLPLFDPASEWVEYVSNSCGPDNAAGYGASTGVCPTRVEYGIVYLGQKVAMVRVNATHTTTDGATRTKWTQDACDYYGWVIYHCVDGTDTIAPTASPSAAPSDSPTPPPTHSPTREGEFYNAVTVSKDDYGSCAAYSDTCVQVDMTVCSGGGRRLAVYPTYITGTAPSTITNAQCIEAAGEITDGRFYQSPTGGGWTYIANGCVVEGSGQLRTIWNVKPDSPSSCGENYPGTTLPSLCVNLNPNPQPTPSPTLDPYSRVTIPSELTKSQCHEYYESSGAWHYTVESSAAKPPGCSLWVNPPTGATYEYVYWNENAASTHACSALSCLTSSPRCYFCIGPTPGTPTAAPTPYCDYGVQTPSSTWKVSGTYALWGSSTFQMMIDGSETNGWWFSASNNEVVTFEFSLGSTWLFVGGISGNFYSSYGWNARAVGVQYLGQDYQWYNLGTGSVAHIEAGMTDYFLGLNGGGVLTKRLRLAFDRGTGSGGVFVGEVAALLGCVPATGSPTSPTSTAPSASPSHSPTTASPTTGSPTVYPSGAPSGAPTVKPTRTPTTGAPTLPGATLAPSPSPTIYPTGAPTEAPVVVDVVLTTATLPDADSIANAGIVVDEVSAECVADCTAICARADTTCVTARMRRLTTTTVTFTVDQADIAALTTALADLADSLGATTVTMTVVVDVAELSNVLSEISEATGEDAVLTSVALDTTGVAAAHLDAEINALSATLAALPTFDASTVALSTSAGALVLCNSTTERRWDGVCEDCAGLTLAHALGPRVRPVLPVPRQPRAHVVAERGAERGADGGPKRGPYSVAERSAERGAERSAEPPTYVKPERLADTLDNVSAVGLAVGRAVARTHWVPERGADSTDDGTDDRFAVEGLPIQR